MMATLACLLKTKEDRFQLNAERILQLIEGRKGAQAGVAAAMKPASSQAQAA